MKAWYVRRVKTEALPPNSLKAFPTLGSMFEHLGPYCTRKEARAASTWGEVYSVNEDRHTMTVATKGL